MQTSLTLRRSGRPEPWTWTEAFKALRTGGRNGARPIFWPASPSAQAFAPGPVSNPDKFVQAAPFPFLLAALIVLAFGPAAFSWTLPCFPQTGLGLANGTARIPGLRGMRKAKA